MDERTQAARIVDDGIRTYFASRRDRVGPFVDRTFSLKGSLKLHRAAVGWDIARGPVNLALALPQVGLLAGANLARKLGADRTASRMGKTKLLLETEVGREILWRLHADFLELPFRDGDRVTTKDVLAETILSDPRVIEAITPALETIAASGNDPALRQRLEAAMTEYGRTRGAATEITTALMTLGAGAMALNKLTPGAITLGPMLATAIAQQSAILAFPFGSTLGSIWYAIFPAAPSSALVAGLTGGLFMAATVFAAFAGVVADPVQRQVGLHQRRLIKMVDALERQMLDPAAPGFVVHDHYVARLVDLFDVVGAVVRLAAH